jgi:pimeloyl-ACP methyl ester carboxylesterase
MPSESSNQIHFQNVGRGTPALLFHGLGASNHDWDLLIPDLVATGYQCYAPDLPGHGDSLKPDDIQRYHVEEIYTEIETWASRQSISEPAVVIGHSLGGYLSLLYAMRNPGKVRAMILVDPLFSHSQLPVSAGMLNRHLKWAVMAMQYAPQWLIYALTGLDPQTSKYFSDRDRKRVAEDYKRASPNIMYITQSVSDLTPQLKWLDQPALVLWGNKDRTLSPNTFPRLVNLLHDARGIPVDGSGHQPHLSHPKQVNHSILQFLHHLQEFPSNRQVEQLTKSQPLNSAA